MPVLGKQDQSSTSFEELMSKKSQQAETPDAKNPQEPEQEEAAPAVGNEETTKPTAEQEEAAAAVLTAPVVLPEAVVVVEEETAAVPEAVPQVAVGQEEAVAVAAVVQEPVQAQGPQLQTAGQPTEEAAPETISQQAPQPQPQEAPVEEAAPQESRQETGTQTRSDRPTVENVHTKPQEETSDGEEAPAEAPVFDRVEAVPVKVAAAKSESVELETPRAPEQIVRQVAQAMDQGETRVELTLSPENLGRLTVEISRDSSGTLSVTITAANPKAAALLEQHTGNLSNLLMAKNDQAEVRVEVRSNEEAQQQFLNPDDSHNRGQQQRQQQEQHSGGGDSKEFLQKLRLGLVSFTEQIF